MSLTMIGWKMMNNKEIENYLNELFQDPKCELEYSKDYELLIATVLSAQTTDKKVNEVTRVLFKKYNNLEKLSKASNEDLVSIISPIGMANKKSIYVKEIAKYLLEYYNGVVPNDEEKLTCIPGVGRKTSNVVRSNLFKYPAIAVDTHVSRVSKRLKIAREDDNVLIIEKKLMKFFPKENWSKLHHQLVLFGRYYCTSRNPKCSECKLKNICKYYKTH